jgi:hypothetical protein
MHEPFRIEVVDEPSARELRRFLSRFAVETVAVDGHYELQIGLVEINPERRIVHALNAIDSWLSTGAADSVRVHLDGSSYTLHAPRD